MKTLTTDGARIEAICACLPKHAAANDEKLVASTGIRTRRIAADGTTAVDLCVAAAERAIADAGAKTDDFGALVFVSFTQPNRMPAAACEAQARLGLPKDMIAFDVSLACSGWGYGLYLASLLARQTGKKTLLLDGDVQSAKATDAATAPLFGDAGTATVVGVDLNTGSQRHGEAWRFAFVSDGEKRAALQLKEGGTIQMDGFGVFRFVATDVVTCMREFADRRTTATSGYDFFVPHQPNVYMVRQLAKNVGIPEEKTMISCDELGNLSSASVPVTIARKNVRGKVLFAGFGGGLSVSLGAIDVSDACRLSVMEV